MVRTPRWTKRLAVAALAVALPVQDPDAEKPAAKPAALQLAVIVNPKNATTGLSLVDLRQYFKLEKQFWNRARVKLCVPPSSSTEARMLLELIYERSEREMRAYWKGRMFRGEIPALPTVSRNAAAAGALVRGDEGAISVVLASEVPEGVRVLAIDGKLPGQAGYPLSAAAGEPKTPPKNEGA